MNKQKDHLMAENRRIPYKIALYTLFLYSLIFFFSQTQFQNITFLQKIFSNKIENVDLTLSYFVGLLAILILILLLKDRSAYLSIIFLVVILAGSIYINFFNNGNYFPHYITTEPGDFYTLGKKRWKKEFPYKVYYTSHEEYLLQTINVNPGIDDFLELGRVNNFGIYLNSAEAYPISLTEDQYHVLSQMDKDAFVSIKYLDREFRLYISTLPDEDILLTTYKNLILFIPQGLISE